MIVDDLIKQVMADTGKSVHHCYIDIWHKMIELNKQGIKIDFIESGDSIALTSKERKEKLKRKQL